MKVTGYKIREALKMAQLELSTIGSQFGDSLFCFEGEAKPSPKNIIISIQQLERNIARLQTAQAMYNLTVMITVGHERLTLEEAIKRVGGAGRISKMWRVAAQGNQVDKWELRQSMSRKTDEIQAQPTISKIEALEETKVSEKYASALRNAIAIGNTTEVTLDSIDLTGLFER